MLKKLRFKFLAVIFLSIAANALIKAQMSNNIPEDSKLGTFHEYNDGVIVACLAPKKDCAVYDGKIHKYKDEIPTISGN